MPSNLCCGGSLQMGSKIIGIVQSIIAVIVFSFYTVGVIEDSKTGFELSGGAKFGIAINYITTIISFGFGVLLFVGAKNRDIPKCQMWIYANVILAIFYAIMFVLEIIVNGNGKGAGVHIVSLLILGYFISVVHYFIQEIHDSPDGPQPIV